MGDTCGNASRYDVTWDSPSGEGESGSMPLGNGDIGLNAWVDTSGSLLFYISKTDSWDESGRLLKVGKLRIDLGSEHPLPLTPFLQTLDLAAGTIVMTCGEEETAVHLRLWVDANHPAICVEIDSSLPLAATASIELWRLQPLALPSIETSDVMLNHNEEGGQHAPTVVEQDVVLAARPGCIGWYHHNARAAGPTVTAANQGLDGFDRPDPLLHRTFGAVVTSSGATAHGDR